MKEKEPKKFSMWKALSDLGYYSYDEYLAGDHWKEFKLRYRKSPYPKTCMVCESKKAQLHHKTYRRLGCELLTDVVPLCGFHHNAVHQWLQEKKLGVGCTGAAVDALRKKHIKAREKKDVDPFGMKYRFKTDLAECQSLASRILQHHDRDWARDKQHLFEGMCALVKGRKLVELRRRWCTVLILDGRIEGVSEVKGKFMGLPE